MRAAVALLCLLFASPVLAGEIEVDVELVLAADVSTSMDQFELQMQRQGYAQAISSADFVNAVRDGQVGKIALTYIEWSGKTEQWIVVDWRMIDNGAAARAFSRDILRAPINKGTMTSISGAMIYASGRFDGNGFAGLRRVIDISGDGKQNDGPPLEAARDAVTGSRITVNGLPIATGEPGVVEYYRTDVIGGPASFLVPVEDVNGFPSALRKKLVWEIAAR